jgi:hypothetical protein
VQLCVILMQKDIKVENLKIFCRHFLFVKNGDGKEGGGPKDLANENSWVASSFPPCELHHFSWDSSFKSTVIRCPCTTRSCRWQRNFTVSCMAVLKSASSVFRVVSQRPILYTPVDSRRHFYSLWTTVYFVAFSSFIFCLDIWEQNSILASMT